MYEFYRQTIIGRALQDTLEGLIKDDTVNIDQAQKILKTFDETIPVIFNRTVNSSLTFKGVVESYNYVDGVWN
ncbi:Transcription initiation factor IIA, gamma subunit [Pseudoloma neurophilia]|uniref:Transcription initiation factor IIA subunit 2 n=2 Tax=Pseudoloma neurophilia TaxID=146866 RepID=A0A0R0LRL7_9MICR|nr:Transcription initiation factor IIA, gamma subunit [Pseudoloma neurophilia]